MIVPARTPDERLTLVAYLASKIGITPQELVGAMPYEIVAVTRDGQPVGAVLYINWRGHSIEMACAGEPGWLTRAHLRTLFEYPFIQLGCYTVLTTVKRTNAKARRFNEKLGFVTLGVIESGNRSDDTILNSMTRKQCRWLAAEPAHVSVPLPTTSIGAHAHG